MPQLLVAAYSAARTLCSLDEGVREGFSATNAVLLGVLGVVGALLGALGVAAYTFNKGEFVSSIWRRLRMMGFKRQATEDDYKKMTPPPASRPKQQYEYQTTQIVDVIVTDAGVHPDIRHHLIETLRSNDPQTHKCQEQKPKCQDAGPSAKEKALADAARARLYGNSTPADCSSDQGAPILPTGPEPVAVDVVYYTRGELAPIDGGEEAVSGALEHGLQGASSKQWTDVIAALNQIRQVSVHHASALQPRLHEAVPLVVQQVKSLRSSVCKTSLLCVSDLVTDFGDGILPWLDVGGASQPGTSLLCQLLLKAASKDKKFVIEEAERSLRCICESLSPADLYPLLPPYLKHKNQKVRGAASGCAASVLGRMSDQELTRDDGLSRHLETMGPLVSDKTKEAREASRQIVLLLHTVFSRQQQQQPPSGGAGSGSSSTWEGLVSAQLGASAALTVLKITGPQQQQKPR